MNAGVEYGDLASVSVNIPSSSSPLGGGGGGGGGAIHHQAPMLYNTLDEPVSKTIVREKQKDIRRF